jgi:Mg-chelatase subunit ChlD
MGPLRQLVRRIVEALVAELAVRVRPAITGAILPRTTRRRGGKLHLRRTVTANLRTARVAKDGTVTVVPESTYFHVRGRRSFDWRVVLCVDVSGSMEESVVYSALMAAILSGLPALTTNFVAFSDRVVDLSDRVEDPLGLLLEIRVGGGTHIAAALSYARTLVTVPARTIVVVVSDFEEGGPISELIAEVRALAGGGSRLLGLAALDDRGAPRYDTGIAEQLVAAGMPIAALTPMELARWLGERLRGD